MIADMKRELGELAVAVASAQRRLFAGKERNGYLYIGMGQMTSNRCWGLKKAFCTAAGFMAMLCAALLLKDLRAQGNEEGEKNEGFSDFPIPQTV